VAPMREAGVPAELARLAAGDVEIIGRRAGGIPYLIGVEFKQWGDVLQCIRDGRFSEQLRAMRETFEVNWLLIEGRIRVGADGRLEMKRPNDGWYSPPSRQSYQEAEAWVLTMSARAGVIPWRTETRAETVAWLRTLYLWATASDWESHRAHLAFYVPPWDSGDVNPLEGATPEQARRQQVMRTAMSLPRVGAGKVARIADEFGTVAEMVGADAKRWATIKGIGKRDSETITRAIRGE
jgi:ERCC4-type nuclease